MRVGRKFPPFPTAKPQHQHRTYDGLAISNATPEYTKNINMPHLEQHFAEHDLPGQPNIHAPAEHPHVLKQLPHPDNQDPLSHLEVKNAISKLKNAMTMGLDGLRKESLKYDSSDKLLENLCRLIFEVRDGEKTRESWRISRLTYLWKWKGSSLKPAKHTALNYRIIEQTDHYNEARSDAQGLRI